MYIDKEHFITSITKRFIRKAMCIRLSGRILIRSEAIITKIKKRESGFIISIFNSILFILCSNKVHTVVMTGMGFNLFRIYATKYGKTAFIIKKQCFLQL